MDRSLIEMTDWCTTVGIQDLKNFALTNYIINNSVIKQNYMGITYNKCEA